MSPAPARSTPWPAIAAVCAVFSVGSGAAMNLLASGAERAETATTAREAATRADATAREVGELRTRAAVSDARVDGFEKRFDRLEAKVDRLLQAAGVK